jgi:hypothetical protein
LHLRLRRIRAPRHATSRQTIARQRDQRLAILFTEKAASNHHSSATALVRLDEGLSCQEVAKVLLFDDDTIRGWYELFEQDGVEGLSRFEMGGSSGKMSAEQCDALKAWVGRPFRARRAWSGPGSPRNLGSSTKAARG